MVLPKETAEEQLLRMIEGSQGPQRSSAPAPAPGRFSSWWEKLFSPRPRRIEADPFLLKLQLGSRFLWVILVGFAVYLVLSLFVMQPRHPAISTSTKEVPAAELSTAVQSPLKPLPQYLEGFQQRNPFTGAVAGQSVVVEKKSRLQEAVQGLTLVGIDRGPNPAAIIENSAQQKSTVVSVGDNINGLKVKKITSEGVVLSDDVEEFLLR